MSLPKQGTAQGFGDEVACRRSFGMAYSSEELASRVLFEKTSMFGERQRIG
jgi:hypothetical protein